MPIKNTKFRKGCMSQQTYFVNLRCFNCGCRLGLRIPKGTTIVDYCMTSKCPDCGCRELYGTK